MKRWVDRIINDHRLSLVEADFLKSVYNTTQGVPRVPRREFVRDTAEVLSSRPPVERPSQLVEALGQPSIHARDWMHIEGFDRWVSPWRRWWLQPRSDRVGQLAVTAVLVTGVAIASAYYNATPEIGNNCSGGYGPTVERLEAAGALEYRMPFEPGARYGMYICPSVPDGVTIQRISMSGGPREMGIQPVGVELQMQPNGSLRGEAEVNPTYPVHERWHAMVWFEGEYCNNFGGGGGFFFDRLAVDYRYRGRDRTTEIPLLARYSVVYDDGACDLDAHDSIRERWQSSVDAGGGRSIVLSSGPYGVLGLDAQSVSRDLCRYLRGISPVGVSDGNAAYGQFESLEERAVFHLDRVIAEPLIDGAVLGVCPEFQDRREELYSLVVERG